ncbi:hypothetical protein [Oryzifoliimicrobium ureilyticus]|uniref:hypothetical protein n=1 Tax=Oryzifoliimicrobium ureilyticus TaxID=3113724 RepID=UPI003076355A
MGQSYSAYLKTALTAKSVRQIYAIAIAIYEDPSSSTQLKSASANLIKKVEQIIDLPIARAAFVASIWRDFRRLQSTLQIEETRSNAVSARKLENCTHYFQSN